MPVFIEGSIVDDRDPKGESKLFGRAAQTLKAWQNMERRLSISVRSATGDARQSVRTLTEGGAPSGELFFMKDDEHYGQTAERARPDFIIEDDCKGIGGVAAMTYPKGKLEQSKNKVNHNTRVPRDRSSTG